MPDGSGGLAINCQRYCSANFPPPSVTSANIGGTSGSALYCTRLAEQPFAARRSRTAHRHAATFRMLKIVD